MSCNSTLWISNPFLFASNNEISNKNSSSADKPSKAFSCDIPNCSSITAFCCLTSFTLFKTKSLSLENPKDIKLCSFSCFSNSRDFLFSSVIVSAIKPISSPKVILFSLICNSLSSIPCASKPVWLTLSNSWFKTLISLSSCKFFNLNNASPCTPSASNSLIVVSKSVSVSSLKKVAASSAALFKKPATLVTAGESTSPSASPASPTAFFICSIAPCIVSVCSVACPPKTSAKLPVNDSSLSVDPTAPVTSIPYLDSALVDEPNVLDTKSAATVNSIPLAAARSNVASVAAIIASSSLTNEPISACASITCSSPNIVTFCIAFAWFNSFCDVFPSAASNFFSASSCCPNKSIDDFIAPNNALAPK